MSPLNFSRKLITAHSADQWTLFLRRMKVSRKGKDLASLPITEMKEDEFNLNYRGKRDNNADILSDSYLMPRRRRAAAGNLLCTIS